MRLEGTSEGCAECGAELGGEPATGGLCAACLETEYPPVAVRGAKWSPLALGVLSLFCDPLMIPTVLAIVRGVGELREVGRREARGIYREEHAQVRTGAVWGILIAAARPLAVGLVLLFGAVVGSADSSLPHAVMEADEVAEILERVGSDDEAERELALRHLDEVAEGLSSGETRRLLDMVEPEAVPTLDRATRSSIVGSALRTPHGVTMYLPRFAQLYPTLDAYGREAVLRRLIEGGTPETLRELARLAGADSDPQGPYLPVVELSAHRADAELFVAPLVRLPAGASLRQGVPALLASLCRAGLGESVLAPVHDRLLADSTATRASLPSVSARMDPGSVWLVERARLQLEALRCLAGDDVDALLVEASEHEDALVAVMAARALLSRDRPVRRATLQRLAADPYSRFELVEALQSRGREREVAAAHRSERALAESQLLRTVYFDEDPLLSVAWIERVEPRPGAAVHVFTATYRELDGEPASERVAVGLYPESLGGDRPRLFWEGALSEDAGRTNADLARQLLVEHDDTALEEDAP